VLLLRPASRAQQKHVVESPRVMTGVLTALAALCLVVGPALGLPRLWTHHEALLGRWLEPVTTLAATLRSGAESTTLTEWLLMLASLAMAALGWLGARALYRDLGASSAALVSLRNRYDRAHAFVFEKYRVDELYDRVFVRTFRGLARFAAWFDAHVLDALILFVASLARAAATLSDVIDRHLVDGAVHAVSTSLLGGGRAVSRLQTGRINNYVLGVAVGIVILIVLTSWL
jgi:NADH:ubiquinone oxidoreductase subunit 5 (subunit L)/multisubunit Na+/H+ antiporter MnhA subunit